MVLGFGIDLCTVARLQKELDAPVPGFLEAVFTAAEIAHCESKPHPAEHFAACFAAKEATVKALAGGGATGSFWRDIEVVDDGVGAPRLALHGRARSIADGLGVRRWHLTLAHDRQFATATVFAEGPP
jgi:holo-[acyl-carrier protein] synthase